MYTGTVKRSSIGWTDYTGGPANFVYGCTRISEGCANCYAFALADRYGARLSMERVKYDEDKLRKLVRCKMPPIKRDRAMCFVVDMGDLFHEDVPDYFIFKALSVLAARPDVDFQILTKRVYRAWKLLQNYGLSPNIWLGASVENQHRADQRVSLLLDIPAHVRWVSVEPMLESVHMPELFLLDWVVCGAESGAHRRPFDPVWAQVLYEQCKKANIPFYGKQASAFYPELPLRLNVGPGQEAEVKEWPC